MDEPFSEIELPTATDVEDLREFKLKMRGQSVQDFTDRKPRRACTDIPCLLMFFLYWAGMLTIMGYAAKYGNIDKVTHGYDWTGDICGYDEDVIFKPYLYWCKVGDGQLSDPICVESCPSGATTSHRCPKKAYIRKSTLELPQHAENRTVIVTRTLEWMPDIATKPAFKYCLPRDSTLLDSISNSPVVSGISSQLRMALESLIDAKFFLLGVMVLAVVYNFVFLALVKWCISILIHVLFLTFILSLLFIGLWGLMVGMPQDIEDAYLSQLVKDFPIVEKFPHANPLTHLLAPEVARRTALAIGCLGFLLGSVVACVWCGSCKAIGKTTEAVKDACDVLYERPSILLQPVIQIFIQVSCLAFILFRMLLVISLGHVETTNALDTDSAFSVAGIPIQFGGMYRSFVFSNHQWYMIVYSLLGSVWIYETVAAAGHFAIAEAVTKRKLRKTHDRRCAKNLPLTAGYFNGVVFHLGTLATGAFIMGVLRILTAVVAIVSREADSGRHATGGRTNPVARGVSCCCCCCLSCATWVTQTVNDLAYVDVIVYGHSYFEAAWHVYRKTLTDVAGSLVVVGTTRAIRNVGMLSTTALGVCGAYWCLTKPAAAAVLGDLGVYHTGSLGSDVGFGIFEGSVVGITAMSGLICWLVSLAFMNVLVATTQSLKYLEVLREEQKYGDASRRDLLLRRPESGSSGQMGT